MDKKKATHEANFCIGTGLGVGALGAGATIALGATCPICVVAAPALVGVGLFQKAKLKRLEKQAIPNQIKEKEEE